MTSRPTAAAAVNDAGTATWFDAPSGPERVGEEHEGRPHSVTAPWID